MDLLEGERQPQEETSIEKRIQFKQDIDALTDTLIVRIVAPLQKSEPTLVERFVEQFQPEEGRVDSMKNRRALGIASGAFSAEEISLLKVSDFAAESQKSIVDANGRVRIPTVGDMSYVQYLKAIDGKRQEIIYGNDSIPDKLFEELERAEEPLQSLSVFFFPTVDSLREVYDAEYPALADRPDLLLRQHILNHILLIHFVGQLDEPPAARIDVTELIRQRFELERETEREKEIQGWTVEYVLAEKTKDLPIPSPDLRFSVQVPAYNELPVVPGRQNPRGHLADFLMSAVIAAAEFDKKGGSIKNGGASEIEILININNADSQKTLAADGSEHPGTRANRNALLLLSSINRDDISVEECVKGFEWVAFSSDPRDPAYQTYKFYILLITRARALRQKGMQFNAIDCTDGMFISRYNEREQLVNYQSNQGSRRELLAKTAEKRFVKSKSPMEKVHIFFDADITFSRNYFVAQAEKFNKKESKVGPRGFLSAYRIVSPLDLDLDESDRFMGRFEAVIQTVAITSVFLYRDFANLSKEFKKRFPRKALRLLVLMKELIPVKSKQVRGIDPFTALMSTWAINQAAFEKVGHWSIFPQRKNGGGTDAQFVENLIENKVPINWNSQVLTSIKHRISERSWMGRYKEKSIGSLQFNEFMAQATRVFQAQVNGGEREAEDLPSDLSATQFSNFFIDLLQSIPNPTRRERELQKRFGLRNKRENQSNRIRLVNPLHLSVRIATSISARGASIYREEDYGSNFQRMLGDLGVILSLGRTVFGVQNPLTDYPHFSKLYIDFGDCLITASEELKRTGYKEHGDPLRITYVEN